MVNNWDKFLLLMWKNWKLQSKHKVQLMVEILLPVIFTTILVLVRNLVSPQTFENPTTFKSVDIEFSLSIDLIKKWEIAYYPKSSCLEDVAGYAENWLTQHNNIEIPNITTKPNIKLVPYDDVSQIEKEVTINQIIAAIQFDESFKNESNCPKMLKYAIKFPSELRVNFDSSNVANWETNFIYPLFDFGGPRLGKEMDVDGKPSYYNEGFIGIQHALALGFINKYKNVGEDTSTWFNIKRFPYPPYIFDPLLTALESFISFIILISFVYPCSQTVKYVTTEKEKQLKEVMKIMGLPSWLHWTAWFIKTFPIACITTVLMIILYKIPFGEGNLAILTFSDWSTLLFFLIGFCISLITFCFMIATFFTKASTAASVSGLLWFVSYLPFSFTQNNYKDMLLSQKLGLSLFSNTAMAYGFKLILKFEGIGEGLQWSNLFRPVNSDDNLSVGTLVMMMLLDSLLHMVIALYVEKIFPGAFGVAEKWYFPFTKGFWFPNSIRPDAFSEDVNATKALDTSAFEDEPKNKKVGLSIKNLRKTFKDKVAVEKLTLNMYEDDITVLLGHNGAGKTTTISMLTGMIPPTSGTATLNGYDIRTNLMNARMSLGICPQHNILFDELTVREHIIFFSRLKGMKNEEVNAEVQKYVGLLELEHKIDSASKELSGGMKRKLSVAAALCGGSKVVLCDEPTSGMDPSARRALWDLLEGERKGRTILLTTHFMDEADVLGDRIAIMCSGELKACGSSFYLKKVFGAGYHLICVKKKGCDTSQITTLLQRYIPDILVESDIGSELSYQLPEKYVDKFQKMFAELEEKTEELKLDGYGVSNTTLEEVFMLVGSDRIKENKTTSNGISNENLHNDTNSTYTLTHDNFYLNTGLILMVNQWRAMFMKKFLYLIRNYISFLLQNFMPIFFVVITILVTKAIDPFKTLKPLTFDLNRYSKTVTVMQSKANTDDFENKILSEYKNYIQSFANNHAYVEIKEDFEDYILKLEKSDLVRVNSNYVIGGTIGSQNLTAWFNAQFLHALPLTLNAIHNAVLRATTNSLYTIDVTNQPLPYTEKTKLENNSAQQLGFNLALNLAFAMSFVSVFYIIFQIKERVNRAKLLQFVSGVRVLTFWLSQFIFDFSTFLITAFLTVVTIACFQEECFSTAAELSRVFMIFILFGIASLPTTYLFAFFFTEAATGFSRLSIFNIFTGIALALLVFFLKLLVDNDTALTANSVFLIFPHYLLFKSLDNVNSISGTIYQCIRLCEAWFPNTNCNMEIACLMEDKCCSVPDFFAWEQPGIASHFVYAFGICLLSFLALFIKEYRVLHEAYFFIGRTINQKYYKTVLETYGTNEDDDVKEEKLRISRMSNEDISKTNLVLDHVTKFYWKFLAVKKISAAINSFECFGLLGLNGAGKTSTFKMMTGDERISYGKAYVKGLPIKKDMNAVYREIGYCPQFDALLEELTGRETLKMFALLRGIPNIDLVIRNIANSFGFEKHIDKRISSYSGGNKRKLSAAIAFMGNPTVIYLDEPTTGMDPGAKRQLWNKVCEIRDSGKSIVLTSHSMEECEALCTRLAIMVNGEFKCIGSTQHLKNKFSKGFVLKIKIRRNENINLQRLSRLNSLNENEDFPKIIQFVKHNFKQAEIKEMHQGLLTFYIPFTDCKWSEMFGIMEANRKQLQIEDYSISQTTLEEIFLEFAKLQQN